jgi:hypothetical protein
MLISFERDRLREFEEQCTEANISVSEGVRQLVDQELEKKAEGECPNPCNISYITYSNKSSQSDLRDWLPRKEAIDKAKKMPLGISDWKHLKETFQIIYDKKRTGYL